MPILIQKMHPRRMTRQFVRRAIDETLRSEGVSPRSVEVSVALVDDDAIRALNAQYRGKDTPTDVLSFTQSPDIPVPGSPRLLGDVVISLDTAAVQAAAGGRTLEDEVGWLAIHGVLHLLGYDDATAEGYAEMVGKGTDIWGRISDTPSPAPPGC